MKDEPLNRCHHQVYDAKGEFVEPAEVPHEELGSYDCVDEALSDLICGDSFVHLLNRSGGPPVSHHLPEITADIVSIYLLHDLRAHHGHSRGALLARPGELFQFRRHSGVHGCHLHRGLHSCLLCPCWAVLRGVYDHWGDWQYLLSLHRMESLLPVSLSSGFQRLLLLQSQSL